VSIGLSVARYTIAGGFPHQAKNKKASSCAKPDAEEMRIVNLTIRILGPGEASTLDRVAPGVFDHAIDGVVRERAE